MSMYEKETGWPVVSEDGQFDHELANHAAAYNAEDLMEDAYDHAAQINALLAVNNSAAAGSLLLEIRKNTIQRRAEFSHYSQILTPVFRGVTA